MKAVQKVKKTSTKKSDLWFVSPLTSAFVNVVCSIEQQTARNRFVFQVLRMKPSPSKKEAL